MTAPNPTYRTQLVLGVESVYGTPVTGNFSIPVTSLTPSDKLELLKDMGWRGSAVESYGHVSGPLFANMDFGGDVFPDAIGFPLVGILGDQVVSGTTTAPTGTLSAGSSIGATSVSSSVSIPNGTLIQIDTGVNAEIVTTTGVPTGAGPFAIPVPALGKAHLISVAITAVVVNFTTAASLLNTGSTQPPSYTMIDSDSVNALSYPGMRFSECGLKFDGAGKFEYTAKAVGLSSSIVSAPTASYTAVPIVAGWTGAVSLGGSANATVVTGELNLKRPVDPINSVDGTQAPYNCWAGPLAVDGKLVMAMAVDTYRALYVAGTSTSVDIAFAAGAGASSTLVQAHMSKVTLSKADKTYGKSYIELDIDFEADANITDIGYSAGFSPVRITTKSPVARGIYAP